MSKERALLLAGGDLHPEGPQSHLLQGPWDVVVCADRGASHALSLGLRPSLLVGDFDSINGDVLAKLSSVPTHDFPADKEKTDTQLAVEWALKSGFREVVVGGGIGSRFDHSLANAQLLFLIHRSGANGVVTDGRQAVYLLVGELALSGPEGQVLSVLPLGPECRGLTERGLRWGLDRFDLTLGDTRTISNEFTSEEATLRLEQGTALVVVGPPD